MEDAKSIATYLIELGNDLLTGKPIKTALDALEEALCDWREQFPPVPED